MTARVLIVPGAMPSRDVNGRALPAKLRFYLPGTTTPATVYTDNILSVAHPFPILSDATGMFPPVWADDSNTFDCGWSDQVYDATLGTFSGVSPAADATNASANLAAGYAAQAQAALASTLGAPGTNATCSASRTIATGSLIFPLDQTGKAYSKGQRVVIASSANPLNQMTGIITGFVDPNLTVQVDLASGAGAHADWIISLSGFGAVSSVAALSGAIAASPLKAALALDQVNNTPTIGRQSIWIPAIAMTPRITNGAAPGLVETATNHVMGSTLDFDPNTQQYAQFGIRMPKAWDLGNITFVVEWSHPATSTNFKVAWSLAAVAISRGDAGDAAFGTAVQVNDTGGVTDTFYAAPESAAVTIAGAPAAEDVVIFQLSRVAADAVNDTLAVNARVRGVTVYLNTTKGNDA